LQLSVCEFLAWRRLLTDTMACAAQLVAMQRILKRSLYITGKLKNTMPDAAHLAVHVHHNAASQLLKFSFLC